MRCSDQRLSLLGLVHFGMKTGRHIRGRTLKRWTGIDDSYTAKKLAWNGYLSHDITKYLKVGYLGNACLVRRWTESLWLVDCVNIYSTYKYIYTYSCFWCALLDLFLFIILSLCIPESPCDFGSRICCTVYNNFRARSRCVITKVLDLPLDPPRACRDKNVVTDWLTVV